MKYYLLGDETKILFIEDDKQLYSVFYNKVEETWMYGGTRLLDARIGFDPSEPEDSPYRYGNSSCMPEINEISKNEAEAFIKKPIDDKEIEKILKRNKKETCL